MNRLIRFPCPKCKIGYFSNRLVFSLATDKVNVCFECSACGFKLEDYINGD